MGLQSLERRLERMVEGVFRGSRAAIRPIELGRRLVREMDDQRSVDVKGRRVVPNDFVDPAQPAGLRRLRRHPRRAADRARRGRPRVRPRGGLPLHGPGQRRARPSTRRMRPGRFEVARHAAPGEPAASAPGRWCCRPASGSPLGDRPVTVGRLLRVHDPAQRPERQPPPRRDPPRTAAPTSSSTSARRTARWSTAPASTASSASADGDIMSFGSTYVRFEAS